MTNGDSYQEDLDYLVDYAKTTLVYFYVVRDTAESLAGRGASEKGIQHATLRLIGDMIDRGVVVGDLCPETDAHLIPWDLSKDDALRRIATEMARMESPRDFIDICWFGHS